MRALGADDRIYRTQKIAVLLEALAVEGVPMDRTLEGVGLSEHEIGEPATRVSLTQVFACFRNAIRLSPDPTFAYRTGLRFHLPAYGTYGFASIQMRTREGRLADPVEGERDSRGGRKR